jgi:hypothetical protein
LRLVRASLLAIVTFAICLLIGECSVARLLPRYSFESQLARMERAKQIVRWRPHRQFHHVGDGWRKMHLPDSLSPAKTRVMIVGDSFVMGHGVGAEGRFGNLLSKESGDRLAIAVLGMSSHSTIVYRNTVREALKRSDYDVALIFIDQTDPVDDWLYAPDLTDDEADWNFRIGHMRERYDLLTRALTRLDRKFADRSNGLRRFALYNLARPVDLLEMIPPESPHRDYVRRSLKQRGRRIRRLLGEPDSQSSRALIATTLAYTRDIHRELSARGVRILFVANPWPQHVISSAGKMKGSEPDLPLENCLEIALQTEYAGLEGVDVLPMTRIFRDHENPSRLFFDGTDEIHWSWIGHRYVALKLLDHLLATQASPTHSLNDVVP